MEHVVHTYEPALRRYAARLLNNADAAHDVVQTAFIRLHEHWDECRGWAEDHLRNWLYRTTHNAAVDYIRKEERLRALHGRQAAEIDEAQPEQATGEMEKADRIRLVLEHVADLDEAEREVLILRLQEGLSYEEIARITGRTIGNVGCLLHHAVKNIAKELKKSGAI